MQTDTRQALALLALLLLIAAGAAGAAPVGSAVRRRAGRQSGIVECHALSIH